MRLLFTGGGAASSSLANMSVKGEYAGLRDLAGRYEAHFADADMHAKPYGVSSDRWHWIPPAYSVSFTSSVAELCKRLEIDLLVPGVDEELLPLAMARNWHALPCKVLLPESEIVAMYPDKLLSMRTLSKLGIAVPTTERLKFRDRVSFPCVVKPRFGRGSRHVAAVRNQEELSAHVTMSGCPEADFIVQHGLEGQEYTVTVVADTQQRLRAIVPVKVGLKKGITLRAETDADEAVTDLCQRIHRAYPFSGCINIQCIKQVDGTVQPFEINPRVSTTTCLAIAAGVDVFALYLDEGPVEGLAPFTNHLTMKRSWHTEFAA